MDAEAGGPGRCPPAASRIRRREVLVAGLAAATSGLGCSSAFEQIGVDLNARIDLGQPAQVTEGLDPQPFLVAGGVELTRMARYTLRAVVLGSERYWLDSLSKISPLDLALGWGIVGTPVIHTSLRVRQSARWYVYWLTREGALSIPMTARNSANVHIVPASELIRDATLRLRRGDYVEMVGHLVMATFPGGTQVRSSLTRGDTGAGACELFYVEGLVDQQRGVRYNMPELTSSPA